MREKKDFPTGTAGSQPFTKYGVGQVGGLPHLLHTKVPSRMLVHPRADHVFCLALDLSAHSKVEQLRLTIHCQH